MIDVFGIIRMAIFPLLVIGSGLTFTHFIEEPVEDCRDLAESIVVFDVSSVDEKDNPDKIRDRIPYWGRLLYIPRIFHNMVKQVRPLVLWGAITWYLGLILYMFLRHNIFRDVIGQQAVNRYLSAGSELILVVGAFPWIIAVFIGVLTLFYSTTSPEDKVKKLESVKEKYK